MSSGTSIPLSGSKTTFPQCPQCIGTGNVKNLFLKLEPIWKYQPAFALDLYGISPPPPPHDEQADQLAEEGRVRHWAYSREWVREVQQRQSSEWQALGLHELDSEISNSDRSRLSEGQGRMGDAVAGVVQTARVALSHQHE